MYVVEVKSKVEISQNCVTFSEYMNFTISKDIAQLPNSNELIELEKFYFI
jgi:hypothetical protein